jgi:hypothetical protein
MTSRFARSLAWFTCMAGAVCALAADPPASRPDETTTVRGRVVWLADAVEQQLGVRVVPEARERTLALKTADGKILPLLEDVHGRAFRADERLRQRDVELLVRRYAQTPALQVLRVYGFDAHGHKVELVYWCEVCGITMLELKKCDCCQGPVVLQERPVDGGPPGLAPMDRH